MLGVCFSLTPVTRMSLLSLLMIRNGLRLKTVPRFTKITEYSEMLLCSLSARSLPGGSLLPSSPSRMPSRLPLLLSPWCPGQGRQLSPREGGWPRSLRLCHRRAQPHLLLTTDPRPRRVLNPLLRMPGRQEAQPQLALRRKGGAVAWEAVTIIFGFVNRTDYI